MYKKQTFGNLSEQYRPQSLDDVIGQSTAISEIRETISKSGFWGTVISIVGASGTGKSTIANILSHQYADECCIIEVVGRDVTVEDVRYWKDHYLTGKPLYGDGYVIIVNEMQDLSIDVQKYLLDFVEKVSMSKHIATIFTSMLDPERLTGDRAVYMNALITRCAAGESIYMTDTGSPAFRKEVIEYLTGIAANENIIGADIADIFDRSKGSIRSAVGLLSRIQRGIDNPSKLQTATSNRGIGDKIKRLQEENKALRAKNKRLNRELKITQLSKNKGREPKAATSDSKISIIEKILNEKGNPMKVSDIALESGLTSKQIFGIITGNIRQSNSRFIKIGKGIYFVQ